MNETEAIEVGREALYVMLKIAGPLLGAALAIGLVIALFQALTQMQEMTLSFVPKILVIMVSLVVLMPFMVSTLVTFGESLMDRIVSLG